MKDSRERYAARIEDILACPELAQTSEQHRFALGLSRQGRSIYGYCFGNGSTRISLIAGNHADEPVGPSLLGQFVSYLSDLPNADSLLRDYTWWIIPHPNPDGEERNRPWVSLTGDVAPLAKYLKHRVRELPGDDMEFGFPEEPDAQGIRPENLAIAQWWRSAGGFHLHASLHGMAFAAGPWFLIDSAWKDRSNLIQARCAKAVTDAGYRLHDVERKGEKGFWRIGKGFATCPNSGAMKSFFLEQDDPETASRFHLSSMEFVRTLGVDTLTLVSEMPLFILEGVGETLGPPDPVAEAWRQKLQAFGRKLAQGASDEEIEALAYSSGCIPMSIREQKKLQWQFISAGIEQILSE